MSNYAMMITDDGSGNFTVTAMNTPTTKPAGGTRLTIPWVKNLNAGATGIVVTSATTATPIACTMASAHGLSTGALVKISGGLVMTAINGTFNVTVTGATTFTLDSSVGSGTYTASTATMIPLDNAKELGVAVQAGLRAMLDDRASGN